MESFPLRVLVVDAPSIARDLLVASLEREGMDVVGVASGAAEAIWAAHRSRPAVVLIDVDVPGGAVAATEGIVGRVEGCRVLALCARVDRGAILQMFLAGAGGYVLKGGPSEELVTTVRRAARSQAGLSVDTVAGLMRDLVRDIADLSETRERLRRSEERLRGVIEAAPDAVVIVDRQGEIVLVNRQVELMFGYPRSDLIGRPMEVLVPERFHADHIQHRQEYLSAPRTRWMSSVVGLSGRRMDGREFPVDISLSVLETGEETLIIAFVRDLSERERALEAMRRERRSLGQDAGGSEPVIDLTGEDGGPRSDPTASFGRSG